MQAVYRAIEKHFYTILMLMLAGGFAILLTELLVTAHTDGIQLVAVVASVAGLVLVLAALFVRGRAAVTVAVLLFLLSATGLFGTYEHLESAGEEGERATIQSVESGGYQPVAFHQDDDDKAPTASESSVRSERRPEGGAGTPPPLAPLSLAGLSLMGAVIIVGAPRKKEDALES